MRFNIMFFSNKVKDRILDLLSEEELGSKQIAKRLQKKRGSIQVYLRTLFKDGLVAILNERPPYIYKAICHKAMFNYLDSIIEKHKKEIIPLLDEREIKVLKIINEIKEREKVFLKSKK